jgi:hypothetical protein
MMKTIFITACVSVLALFGTDAETAVINVVDVELGAFDSDIYQSADYSDNFDDGVVGENPTDWVFSGSLPDSSCVIVDSATISPGSVPNALMFQNETASWDYWAGMPVGDAFQTGDVGLSFYMESSQVNGFNFYVQSFSPSFGNPVYLRFYPLGGSGTILDKVSNIAYSGAYNLDQWNDIYLKIRAAQQEFDIYLNGEPLALNQPLDCTPTSTMARWLVYQMPYSKAYYDDLIILSDSTPPWTEKLDFAHVELELETTPGNRYKVYYKDDLSDTEWRLADYFDAAGTTTVWKDFGDAQTGRAHPASSIGSMRFYRIEAVESVTSAQAPGWLQTARFLLMETRDPVANADFSDAAIHLKCQEAVAAGFNTIILDWGGIIGWHRMGHPERWDEVIARYQHVIQIIHSYGMRVGDHHSLGFYETATLPKSYQGVPLDTMGQVDHATGQYSFWNDVTGYLHWFCPNNPDYRRFYSEHLVRLMTETDVDLLMPDDVEIPSSFYTLAVCGCQWCRAAFLADTGQALPPVTDSFFWYNNSNPLFVRWRQLRPSFVGDCYAHFRAACDTVRPDIPWMEYSAQPLSPLFTHRWCRPAEELFRGGNKFIGFEVMGAADHRLQWRYIGAVSKYHHSLTRPEGWPIWNMTYWNSADVQNSKFYEGWAVNVAFGGREWVWTREMVPAAGIGPLFEKENQHLYYRPRSTASVALLHSRLSRDSLSDLYGEYLGEFKMWCAILLENHFSFDVIRDEDLNFETLSKYSGLVLPRATCLTDYGADAIRIFIQNGGTVAATSDLGDRDSLGQSVPDKLPEITSQTGPGLHSGTLGSGTWIWHTDQIAFSGGDASGDPIDDSAHWTIRADIANMLLTYGFEKGPVRPLNAQTSIIVSPMIVPTGELVVHVVDSGLTPQQSADLIIEIDNLPGAAVSVISPEWTGTRTVSVVGGNQITVPRDWLGVYLAIVVENYDN